MLKGGGDKISNYPESHVPDKKLINCPNSKTYVHWDACSCSFLHTESSPQKKFYAENCLYVGLGFADYSGQSSCTFSDSMY